MTEKEIKKIRNMIIWSLDDNQDISEADIAKVFNRAASTINRVIKDKPENWPPGE